MILVLLALTLVAVGRVSGPSAPVGYWRSPAAQDAYQEAYAEAMAELPRPDEVLDVRTRYGVVRTYRFDGPAATRASEPLVLLPGFGSGAPVWADNLASLTRLRTTYLVDLLGEPGYSAQQRPIDTEQDRAAWVDELLAGLPGARFHLVGQSLGGWLATSTALAHPDRIASVTTLDSPLVFGDLSVAAIVRSIPASVPWLPKSWRNDFGSWTANDAPVEDVPVARMIEAGFSGHRMHLPAPRRLDATALSSSDTPFLIIVAGDSRMHRADLVAASARTALRRGTVLVYPGASHAVNGEEPDRIAADLAAFLSTLR